MQNRRKILIIDDEADFSFFIRKNLEKKGNFSVISASNPDAGIAIANKEPIDLILLDIMMPRKDGFKVLEILKSNTKTISVPVVLLTAVGEEEAKIKAAEFYGEDYITKPVSYDALELKINEVLRRHQGIHG